MTTNSIEGQNYCLSRKCKTCERQTTCDLLENVYKERLMYKPFENILEIWEQKRGGADAYNSR